MQIAFVVYTTHLELGRKSMLIKIFIVLLLFVIIGSLFSALLFMFKDDSSSERMVKALTVRISLSVFLFAMLMAGYYFGIIPAHR